MEYAVRLVLNGFLLCADKSNYDKYYESILNLLRPGGVVAFDNVLWQGSVVDDSDHTPDTKVGSSGPQSARQIVQSWPAIQLKHRLNTFGQQAFGTTVLACVNDVIWKSVSQAGA